MTDQLWADIAEWLRPYALFRSELLASAAVASAAVKPVEDQIVAEYYEHVDNVDQMRENMVQAITEAAFIALADEDDPSECEHQTSGESDPAPES